MWNRQWRTVKHLEAQLIDVEQCGDVGPGDVGPPQLGWTAARVEGFVDTVGLFAQAGEKACLVQICFFLGSFKGTRGA